MKGKGKVLIVDEMHESILPLLKKEGYDPVYMPVLNRENILKIIPDFVGLIIRSKTKVDQELIDEAKALKFVARAGAGIDKLDKKHLDHKGITIVNAPEGNRDALGEHALGMLLSLLHRLHLPNDQIRNGIWDREGNRGIELKGKVVGIYGVGYMGKAFAEKLSGLGCEVIGYDKYYQTFSNEYIQAVPLDVLMDRTEILSIHVPLKADTRCLFDKDYLLQFNSLRILINTSRGKVLKIADLLNLLASGKIYGAALDVLENEKLKTYTEEEENALKKLLNHSNVLITPHVGGWTFESYERINEVLIKKLKKSFQF
ncbi:MAG: phosphoglycerate dehydrogenase [Ekhidna sp.]|nr:phosphoglycerate dehydrogenase [Ekhidna sp.]